MCIILAPVEEVNATKIFTCLTADQKGQFLVYSNQVTTDEEYNVMILPVPNPDTVKFINLSKYPKFFDDLQANFKKTSRSHSSNSYSLSRSASLADSVERPKLIVHDVGAYSASIVPSVDDFDRVDSAHFTLPKDLEKILRQTYATKTDRFGFIVCKLKRGRHSYHPFAYTHQTHSNNLLFVPTLHYHPHGGSSGFLQKTFGFGSRNFELKNAIDADWDHVIYSLGTDLDTTTNDNYYFSPLNVIQWEKLPVDVRWGWDQRIKRWTRKGQGKNQDLWLAGNLKDPIRSDEDTSMSSWSGQGELRSYNESSYDYSFPMTENGRKNLQRYFGHPE